jgi:hypothetical protein
LRGEKKNERVDGVKWEGDGRVDGRIGGKKQSSLFWGSQKGVLFFQMKKNCSY